MEDLQMALIEVKNLKYRYPNTSRLALDDISFTADSGEVIGIAGANGAGKSTLAQALAGLVPQFYKGAYGGHVLIDGQDASKVPVCELCRTVGLVFQNPFSQMSGAKETVFEEAAFGLQNLGIPSDEIRSRTEHVLSLLGLTSVSDRNPFSLSGGQMQRTAIAGILAMQPRVLILDEPTSQLDPAGTEEVFESVRRLAGSGITILIVEQKMEKLARFCEKILLLKDGRLEGFDTPAHIFSRDNLDSCGICPPVYVSLCRSMHIRKPDGTFPVTESETLQLLPTVPDAAAQLEHAVEALYHSSSSLLSEYGIQPQVSGNATVSENLHTTFEIRNVEFSYTPDVSVLSELNLTLDTRPTAVIGQNGAGKTTLARLLKGLLKPNQGQIIYKKKDLAGQTVASLAGEIGYVFQNPDDQIFKSRVLDEVMFGPLQIGMTREKAEEAARSALSLTGLLHTSDENPYDLELSERKMIALASVLAMNPQVLILDEPTIAQDMTGRRKIGNIIKKMASEGRLVFSILHDMDFAAETFQRILVMAHGRLLADGIPRDIFADEGLLREAGLEPPHLVSLFRKSRLSFR